MKASQSSLGVYCTICRINVILVRKKTKMSYLENNPLLRPWTCLPLLSCSQASQRCLYKVTWFHWFRRTVSADRITPTPEPQSNLQKSLF